MYTPAFANSFVGQRHKLAAQRAPSIHSLGPTRDHTALIGWNCVAYLYSTKCSLRILRFITHLGFQESHKPAKFQSDTVIYHQVMARQIPPGWWMDLMCFFQNFQTSKYFFLSIQAQFSTVLPIIYYAPSQISTIDQCHLLIRHIQSLTPSRGGGYAQTELCLFLHRKKKCLQIVLPMCTPAQPRK